MVAIFRLQINIHLGLFAFKSNFGYLAMTVIVCTTAEDGQRMTASSAKKQMAAFDEFDELSQRSIKGAATLGHATTFAFPLL